MKTRFAGLALVLIVGGVLAPPAALPCSVKKVASPHELVRDADLIVRARAAGYAAEPKKQDGSGRFLPGTIRFEVLEVVKGAKPATGDLVLAGYLSESDDFNDRPVPYAFVRPEGRHGDCFASKYRSGAEHLLFIKSDAGRSRAAWAPLAPTNEQLKGEKDPWLLWVRDEVGRVSEEHE